VGVARGLVTVFVVGLAGAAIGGPAGCLALAPPRSGSVRNLPLPHHAPAEAGGLTLRLAMVHDVLVERFPAHGPAFYRERERLARQALATLADGDAADALWDDVGAGLDRLGRPADAVPVLRDKLARQEARGVGGRGRHASFANLGTVLVHAHMAGAVAGDPAARGRVREGVALLRRAIDVNPGAHFGRERWQVATVEFLLAAADDPSLFARFDLVGNALAEPVDPTRGRLHRPSDDGRGYAVTLDMYARAGDPSELLTTAAAEVREQVPRVGGGRDGRGAVPFDEPVLGIVGMWREGGGANPHFALALGEIMIRVGQRFLAWEAFERASRLADRVHPSPAVRQGFRDHCRRRQEVIEESLPAADVPGLRPRFDAELAYGQAYQAEYRRYEADRVAAGVPLRDPRFYADFEGGRPPIATPPGAEEWYVATDSNRHVGRVLAAARGGAAVGGGLAMYLAAGAVRRRRRALRPRLEVLPGPPGG
jgi:hypothetical protein